MQLSNLSSTSFKGMLKLKDSDGVKISINPQFISTVTDLTKEAQEWERLRMDLPKKERESRYANKATQIDLMNGTSYTTPVEYEKVLTAIEESNKTYNNICCEA